MSKSKKKRTKKYQGADAAMSRPTITRVTAANRNPVSQWWFERKKIAKPVLITGGVVAVIALVVYEILRMIFGW